MPAKRRSKSSGAVRRSDLDAAHARHLLKEAEALGAALKKARRVTAKKLGTAATRSRRFRDAEWQEFLRTYQPPGREAVEAKATTVAGPIGADPKEIVRIMYSRGDLNGYLPTLLVVEQSRIQDLRRAKVIAQIRKLLERADWPFDSERCDVPDHPMSRSVVDEVIQQAQQSAVRRMASVETANDVLAAKAVGDVLSQANWPFGGAAYRPKHLLSRDLIDAVIAQHSVQEAKKRLGEVQVERRKCGINKGPGATSFQRIPAVRAVAREVWTYLACCAWTHTGRLPERIKGVGFLELRGALSRGEVATLTRQTVDLVNLAFPNVARLTPARLAGSIPAEQRRETREAAL